MSAVGKYGHYFGVVADEEEAPLAGPSRNGPSDVVNGLRLSKQQARTSDTHLSPTLTVATSVAPRIPIPAVQRSTQAPATVKPVRSQQGFFYSLAMCCVWTVALIAFSITAAIIHFDIRTLTKRPGSIAWITRWLVVASLASSVVMIGYYSMCSVYALVTLYRHLSASTSDSKWHKATVDLADLDAKLEEMRTQHARLEGEFNSLKEDEILRLVDQIVERYAIKDDQKLRELVDGLLVQSKPYITEKYVSDLVLHKLHSRLTTEDVIALIQKYGGAPISRSEVSIT